MDQKTQHGPRVWFDALAHTVTVDGEFPRCAECGEYGSHEEHQPEALARVAAVLSAVAS